MNADRNAIDLRLHDVFDGIPVQDFSDRFVEFDETGKRVFVLLAVSFFAVRLRFAVRLLRGIDLFE